MSYAAVASHNIPEGEMPQPDQDLLDGHFSGEHAASADIDHKINILPAGTDPEHPPVHHEAPAHPAPIQLHNTSDIEPHHLNVAPEPLKAPPKSSVHIPESGEHEAEELKKQGKQAGKEVKKTAEQAEKKGKEYASQAEKKGKELANEAEKKGKEFSKKAKKEFQEVESQLGPYWEKTKDIVLRPGTLGGLMGVVNVGILSTLGYYAYTRQHQPWDRRIVGSAVAGTLALFGAEGYVAESYLSTPEGKQEAERAKREGSKLYMQTKEVVLRPQVAGGLVGAFNLAVLSTVGYFSYKHWNHPWDRNVVSAVTVGLLGLSGLEGWAGKEYAEKKL